MREAMSIAVRLSAESHTEGGTPGTMAVRERALPGDARWDGRPIARTRHLDEPWDEIEILQGLCHGFGSASDLRQAADSTVRWVQAVVGASSGIRLALPDSQGRLRTTASSGDQTPAGRMRSARRRDAFETKRPSLTSVQGRPEIALAILPLVSRGQAVGVLEVVAPVRLVEKRWRTLDSVVSQAAIVIRSVRRQETLRRRVDSLEAGASLVRRLLVSRDARDAVRSMLRLCHDVLQTPIAAWSAGEDPTSLTFLAVRGVARGRAAALRAGLPTISRAGPIQGTLSEKELVERFAKIVGVKGGTVIEAGDALILVAEDPPPSGGDVAALAALFRDTLDRLHAAAVAQRRSERLDLGIAWTAHEVRAPLLGAKATIETLLEDPDQDVPHRALLARSREELAELAGTVDALLRWAVGRAPLRRQPTDVVRVVQEAIDSSGATRDRVELTAPREVPVRADHRQLRSAVANLITNAVAFSPQDAQVQVSVEAGPETAAVVVRDQGQGVRPEEREEIFDPLVRGSAGTSVRGGKGLGLFIARRVVEAHGGRISLDPSSEGAAFRLEVPVGGRACAS